MIRRRASSVEKDFTPFSPLQGGPSVESVSCSLLEVTVGLRLPALGTISLADSPAEQLLLA